jgi:hypothetical protein
VSKAAFGAVDSHTWSRLMRWTRAKYAGKHPLGMRRLRRRFCDSGRRFAHNGAVFTGASSVTVIRGGLTGRDVEVGDDKRVAVDRFGRRECGEFGQGYLGSAAVVR